MLHAYVFRHAKSSWDDPSLDDFDRPLAPRGRKAAARMGAYLREEGLMPELVLCSTAARAVETWKLASAALGAEVEVKYLRSLYLAPPSRLLTTLRRAPQSVSSLLLVAHNPGLERFVMRLVGSGSKKMLDRLARKYPTAALAEIRLDTERWADVRDGAGRLCRFVKPKDLA